MLIVPLLSTLMIILQPSSSYRLPLSRGSGSSFGFGLRPTTDRFISCAILNSFSASSKIPIILEVNTIIHFSLVSLAPPAYPHTSKSHWIILSGSSTNTIFNFAMLKRLLDASLYGQCLYCICIIYKVKLMKCFTLSKRTVSYVSLVPNRQDDN